MDISSLIDPMNLAYFLGGTAVGAAGQYYAQKLTDHRKKKELQAESDKQFRKLVESMPELISEMKADLLRDKDKYIRECVVLPNNRVTFNSHQQRFAYFEDAHTGLRSKMATLADAEYIVEVGTGNAPIYRFREPFVERLLAERSIK